MKKPAAALAFAAALSLPALAQEKGERWDARIVSASGLVALHPADGSDSVDAEAGMPLDQGDRVVTAAEAWAEIGFDGGSLVTLRENSNFTLERTERDSSSFLLSLGSLLAKIEKLGTRQLRVRTPTAVVAVRGTEFGVEVEDEEQTHVGVYDEGQVEVRGEAGGAEMLQPQQETSVRRGEAPLKAFALKRFLRHHKLARRNRARIREIRRRWKTLTPEKRVELRHQVIERVRQRRQRALFKNDDARRKREHFRIKR
ncbi:MAG: FecR family protein, partial [Elusimicrobiota bacterium]